MSKFAYSVQGVWRSAMKRNPSSVWRIYFGLYSAKELSSWLEAISVLRNIIVHHSRLWNRSLAKQVTNPKGHRDKWLLNPLTDNKKKKPYGVISAMLYLCNAVYPDNQIKEK